MLKSQVSVIIPVYNHASTIARCLASVFEQKMEELEVIIVDDGSTDNLAEILKPWQDKIRVICQDNHGAPSARNVGFRESHGEFLLFCDADIVLKTNAIHKMLGALIGRPKAAYAYSSFKLGFKKFRLWPFSAERLKKMPYIHSTSLVRREFFPGFDESLKKFQDWDLWLTILEHGGTGVWLDEVLFEINPGGTMSRWLPKFLYGFNFLRPVRRYHQAEKIIKEKHGL